MHDDACRSFNAPNQWVVHDSAADGGLASDRVRCLQQLRAWLSTCMDSRMTFMSADRVTVLLRSWLVCSFSWKCRIDASSDCDTEREQRARD